LTLRVFVWFAILATVSAFRWVSTKADQAHFFEFPAKVACVHADIHLFATPVRPIPEYATGTSTADA
jgi:hypothetical protein